MSSPKCLVLSNISCHCRGFDTWKWLFLQSAPGKGSTWRLEDVRWAHCFLIFVNVFPEHDGLKFTTCRYHAWNPNKGTLLLAFRPLKASILWTFLAVSFACPINLVVTLTNRWRTHQIAAHQMRMCISLPVLLLARLIFQLVEIKFSW